MTQASARPTGLLARLSGMQVLVAPECRLWFESCLTHIASTPKVEELLLAAEPSAAAQDDFWYPADDWRASYRPYNVVNGVLHVPVMGVLVNRMGYALGRWATGYTYILKAVERGMADGNVRGIAFLVDSPGGEVAGNFELVAKIASMRGKKPMRAFAADHAYSAAYSISTAADKIMMTRTGGVGSIGVVTMHVDYSAAVKDAGIKVTIIYAGKHKVDGNPYEKLSTEAKARIQARIDDFYGIFVDTVAKNRKLTPEAVRATEALTYGANDALEVGLADGVGVFEESLAAFGQELTLDAGDTTMADQTITQAQLDSAVATARAEGEAAGRAAATTRISAILALAAAATRMAVATKFALTTDLSPEQVDALLQDIPETKAAAPAPAPAPAAARNHFAEAMESSGNPNVGAGAQAEGQEGPKDHAAEILAAYGAASGVKPKAA